MYSPALDWSLVPTLIVKAFRSTTEVSLGVPSAICSSKLGVAQHELRYSLDMTYVLQQIVKVIILFPEPIMYSNVPPLRAG